MISSHSPGQNKVIVGSNKTDSVKSYMQTQWTTGVSSAVGSPGSKLLFITSIVSPLNNKITLPE